MRGHGHYYAALHTFVYFIIIFFDTPKIVLLPKEQICHKSNDVHDIRKSADTI